MKSQGQDTGLTGIKPQAAQHTPGPWRFLKDGETRMPEPCNIILSDATGACVAVTKIAFACKANLHARHAEMEANARLIAAAPQLLDTLKSAEVAAIEHLALAETAKNVVQQSIARRNLDSLRAAIALAEGRAE